MDLKERKIEMNEEEEKKEEKAETAEDAAKEPEAVAAEEADAAVFAPLRLLELPHGAILQKFKQPTIRWNDATTLIHATSNMGVAFSNTSFMAGRRCVCIPLRL